MAVASFPSAHDSVPIAVAKSPFAFATTPQANAAEPCTSALSVSLVPVPSHATWAEAVDGANAAPSASSELPMNVADTRRLLKALNIIPSSCQSAALGGRWRRSGGALVQSDAAQAGKLFQLWLQPRF